MPATCVLGIRGDSSELKRWHAAVLHTPRGLHQQRGVTDCAGGRRVSRSGYLLPRGASAQGLCLDRGAWRDGAWDGCQPGDWWARCGHPDAAVGDGWRVSPHGAAAYRAGCRAQRLYHHDPCEGGRGAWPLQRCFLSSSATHRALKAAALQSDTSGLTPRPRQNQEHQRFDLGALLALLPGRWLGPVTQGFCNGLVWVVIWMALVGYIIVVQDCMTPLMPAGTMLSQRRQLLSVRIHKLPLCPLPVTRPLPHLRLALPPTRPASPPPKHLGRAGQRSGAPAEPDGPEVPLVDINLQRRRQFLPLRPALRPPRFGRRLARRRLSDSERRAAAAWCAADRLAAPLPHLPRPIHPCQLEALAHVHSVKPSWLLRHRCHRLLRRDDVLCYYPNVHPADVSRTAGAQSSCIRHSLCRLAITCLVCLPSSLSPRVSSTLTSLSSPPPNPRCAGPQPRPLPDRARW